MSHYAKLIRPLPIDNTGIRGGHVLSVGTSIKGVEIVAGDFVFQALGTNGWIVCVTSEDLPAFTDKGSEHREHRATMRPGRPTVGEGPSTKRVVCKVTPDEFERVKRDAAQKGHPSASAYVRALLFG